MNNLLIILPYIPYPLDNGGNNVIFSMINQLRKNNKISIALDIRSHGVKAQPQPYKEELVKQLKKEWPNITFHLYYGQEKYQEEEFAQSLYCRILRSLQKSFIRKYKRAYKQWAMHSSKGDMARANSSLYNSIVSYNPGFLRFIKDISQQGFDIIQVEMYEYLYLGFILPKHVKKVFIHHELRFIRNKNEVALFKEQNPNDYILFEQMKASEISALQTYDHIVTLTETDKQILSEYISSDKITASPMNIAVCNSKIPFKPCNEFAFVGSGSHFPNQDALHWFCTDILPIIRKKMPNFKLYVTGKWKEKKRLPITRKNPEIEFVGYIDDLTTFLNGKISIVPLRIGSGLRVKILEAIDCMSPFITTSKGVEGLDFKHQKECLIADDAVSFAENLIRLVQNKELQEIITTNAKKQNEKLYNIKTLYSIRNNVYKQLCTCE